MKRFVPSLLSLLLLLLLLAACGPSAPESDAFAPPERLPGVALREAWRRDLFVADPFAGFVADSLLFLCEGRSDAKRFVHCFRLPTGEALSHTVYNGRGPLELQFPANMVRLGDSLLISASGMRCGIYALRSLAAGRPAGRTFRCEGLLKRSSRFVLLPDGGALGYAVPPQSDSVPHLWRVPASGEPVALGGFHDPAELGEELLAQNAADPNRFPLHYAYQPHLALHPEGSLCVAAKGAYRELEVFDCASGRSVARKRYESPRLEVERGPAFIRVGGSTTGYGNLACDAEGVDCTWRHPESDTVHFYRYDWALKLREHYLIALPDRSRRLVMRAPDGRSLYVVSDDPAREDFQLVRYDLP